MLTKRRRDTKPENRVCRVCGSTAGHISKRLLCEPCAIERMTFAARELQARKGPTWDTWKAALRESLDRA